MPLSEVTAVLKSVGRDVGTEGMRMIRRRRSEFRSPEAMLAAGVAMTPEGRQGLDAELSNLFNEGLLSKSKAVLDAPETIAGSGWHAAVLSACRVSLGFPPPLVLEAKDDPGGQFALSKRPSFRANSRNRPGPLGFPGEGRGLNVIVGSPFQPAMFGAQEFQDNVTLALAVRLTLAAYASVRPRSKVVGIDVATSGSRRYAVGLADGSTVMTDRVYDARGLGEPQTQAGVRFDDERLLSFDQFMKRLDRPFPFQNWNRVAVVGGGDGGKCAIEALLGIGPNTLSLAGLDWVDGIDWYDENLPPTKDTWSASTRCRYANIAPYLPRTSADLSALRTSTRPARLRVYKERGAVSNGGLDQTFVNGRSYDAVIMAIGYQPPQDFTIGRTSVYGSVTSSSSPGGIAVLGQKLTSEEVYKIGTRVSVGFDEGDAESVREVPQNVKAIFRLAGRVAQLGLICGMPSKL